MAKGVRALFFVLLMTNLAATTQNPREVHPSNPADAIIAAFRTYDLVTLTDPHGSVQVQAFLLSVLRDPRLPDAVNDIVIEPASARYQDVLDRFERGDDVPTAALRKAWDDHTVPNSYGVQAEEVIREVRDVNVALPPSKKLRVIAGDPPIDWDNVTSAQDHQHWIELRDSYPADLIRRQVLDRGRRALVVYGQGHLARSQIVSNYDMSTWQAQTLVSLLSANPAVRIFNIWTLTDKNSELPEGVASWPMPSLAAVRDTPLGQRDFAAYNPGMGGRFAVRNGQLVPIPKDEWRPMPMQDQFDAILWLGPPSSMTRQPFPTALCSDKAYVATRLHRLTLGAPPVEVAGFKKACGL